MPGNKRASQKRWRARFAFIIKWKPAPRTALRRLLSRQEALTPEERQWVMHRTGKRECVWQEPLDLDQCRAVSPTRHGRVYRLTEDH